MKKVFNVKDDIKRSATPEKVAEDKAIIKKYFPGCEYIIETGITKNDNGIDYIAVYPDLTAPTIDIKRREQGCSKYWTYEEPEIQIEVYSNIEAKHVGWTIDRSKKTDYVIFIFHPSDCKKSYIFPFKELVDVVMIHGREWYKRYFHQIQTQTDGNGRYWHSEILFVPVSILIGAMEEYRKVS